jgi:hypothetical protein
VHFLQANFSANVLSAFSTISVATSKKVRSLILHSGPIYSTRLRLFFGSITEIGNKDMKQAFRYWRAFHLCFVFAPQTLPYALHKSEILVGHHFGSNLSLILSFLSINEHPGISYTRDSFQGNSFMTHVHLCST